MKNSLEQYIKCQAELYGRQAVVGDDGFLIYMPYKDGSVYVHLIYIEPEKRNQGVGSSLVKSLIDHTQCNTLYSYVDTTTLNAEDSLLAHLLFGFKVYSINGTSINMVFKTETKQEEGE